MRTKLTRNIRRLLNSPSVTDQQIQDGKRMPCMRKLSNDQPEVHKIAAYSRICGSHTQSQGQVAFSVQPWRKVLSHTASCHIFATSSALAEASWASTLGSEQGLGSPFPDHNPPRDAHQSWALAAASCSRHEPRAAGSRRQQGKDMVRKLLSTPYPPTNVSAIKSAND